MQTQNQIPFVRELCAHKTEEEIVEAEENFRDFLELADEIIRHAAERGDI